MTIRRLTTLALTATLWMGLAACGGDETTGNPSASRTPSDTQGPTDGPETTAASEPWRDQYSDEQLEAYEAALSRWAGFDERLQPIWEDGTVTPRARAIFQTYFTKTASQVMLNRQRELEFNNIQTFGSANVLWSKPTRISNDATSLEFRQCIDISGYRAEQNGKPLPKTKWAEIPNIQIVSMTKPEGSPWLIESYGDPNGKKQRCNG